MDIESILDRSCARDWQRINSDDKTPLRFAVIGLGWFTRSRALPALESSNLCEPTVVVSSTKEKAERVAANTDGVRQSLTYDDFHEESAQEDYDAVYVCTPNALHLEYARTAAKFGKAVLCEKPMEATSDRAKEMINVCEQYDVPLMVAYRMHTEPAIRRAREIIQQGYVGEPVEVYGSMSQRLLDRVNSDPDQWRLNPELAGGGALFDLGIYPLNTARFLLDSAPLAVTGRTQSTHDAFNEVDETVSFTAVFPADVTVTGFASQNAQQASTVRVTGTEGQVGVEPAFFQDQARELHVSRGDDRMSVTLKKVNQMQEEFDYFADRVYSGGDFYADGEHSLCDMITMEKIYVAANSCEWVSLD